MNEIRSRTTTGADKGFDRSKGAYVRLNTEAWLEAEGIREKGTQRGKIEQPDSSETQPDSEYRHILDFVNQRALDCKNEVRKYLDAQLATLNHFTSHWENENPEITLDAMVDQECHNLESMTDEALVDLKSLRSEHEAMEKELSRFKTENKLTRVADYPNNQLAHWMWVFVAAIAESFVGANLLGSVTRGGIIEGWMIAVILTAVNILIGFGAGRVWQFTNHVVRSIKFVNFFAFATLVLTTLIWNVTAGHIRDVYVLAEAAGNLEAPDQAFAIAFGKLTETPLPWESLQSAGLAFVGIAVFVITAYKSYSSDDRYPGFGKLHRKDEELRDNYQQELAPYLDALKTKRDETKLQIEEFKSRYDLDRASWQNVLDSIKTIRDDYLPNLRQYNNDLAYLLAAYRDANLEARSTHPPQFFDDVLKLDEEEFQKPDIDVPESFKWGDISARTEAGFKRVEETYQNSRNRHEILEYVADSHSPPTE